MGLNETMSADRVHIGFFGVRNAGKSSLVNVVTGQEMAVVSDVKGTTTDPVKKSMEILPIGPVVIIDTPGYDDEGSLGEKRVKRTKEILRSTDLAVLVSDAGRELVPAEKELLKMFEDRKIPYVIARNKSDLLSEIPAETEREIFVSAKTGMGVKELREKLAKVFPKGKERKILSGIVSPGDTAVLVIPIDESAPKGRLIVPQQQVIRELLDMHSVAVSVQVGELERSLHALKEDPAVVITDSQAFRRVSEIVPERVPLTSFSILFAKYKGELRQLLAGASVLSELQDGDPVLISEGCTHHRQCGDIGTVKLPHLIHAFTGNSVKVDTSSGNGFPDDLTKYKLIIHCGGCMLNEREMHARLEMAESAGVPITNYGIAIAKMTGILERSIRPFGEQEE